MLDLPVPVGPTTMMPCRTWHDVMAAGGGRCVWQARVQGRFSGSRETSVGRIAYQNPHPPTHDGSSMGTKPAWRTTAASTDSTHLAHLVQLHALVEPLLVRLQPQVLGHLGKARG